MQYINQIKTIMDDYKIYKSKDGYLIECESITKAKRIFKTKYPNLKIESIEREIIAFSPNRYYIIKIQ